ncbi:MAG: GGDEF domain-containing protein [Proteocatella sp.]
MNIIHSIVILEMTFVNLFISYICLKKKYSSFVTWTILLVFTACFLTVMKFVSNVVPSYGNGNGLIMLFGFLYIIPLKFLYNHSTKYILTIMCSGWIYTMFVFSLSIRLGYLFNEEWIDFSVVLFQTLFYIITLRRLLFFLKNKFVHLIQNIGDETLNLFLEISILWFITGVLINYTFVNVNGGTAILKLIDTLLFILSVLLSFKLFYSLVHLNKTTIKLEEQTKTDSLTKLKNRDGFIEDVQQKIENNALFSVVFIDLDNFKMINDQYGHLEGDAYLIKFAIAVNELFKDYGCLYRMSGDEFIFLCEGQRVNEFCNKIEDEIASEYKNNIKFQGLSSGYATFPQDGTDPSTLMKIADFNMYQNKKAKHKR